MPIKWTAENDQRFLFSIIGSTKVNFDEVVTKWKSLHPEMEAPTKKALEEHVSKLKRNLKGATGGASISTATPKKVTPTSNKRTAPKPKTPSSSAKRMRVINMSDEDDSESEKKMDFDTPLPKRNSLSRRGKDAAKTYRESTDDEEQAESDDGLGPAAVPASTQSYLASSSKQTTGETIAVGDRSDTPICNNDADGVNGTATAPAVPKSAPRARESYDYFSKNDDSDHSDFEPLT